MDLSNGTSNGSVTSTLYECFGCHRTWKTNGIWTTSATSGLRCSRCGSGDVMAYDNERTAALEAAGVE